MDRGAWWATVHRVAKRRIRLSDYTHTHTHTRETEAGEGEQSTLRKRRSPLEGQDSEEERLRKEASLTFNAIYNLWLTRRRTSSGRRSY